MSRILNRVKAFVDHPVTHLIIGLALITTGGMDLYADAIDASRRFHIGAHHGIIILGLAQALSALPDVTHGLERWLLVAEMAKAADSKNETESVLE